MQPTRPYHVFLYTFGFLAQLISYLRIVTTGEPRVRLTLIVLFVYFTMQQYFYRTSHRERFSSLQVGKVCPGKSLCIDEIEWPLMILDLFGPHIVGFLILPMFTLGYRPPSDKKLKKKQA